ncbi:MAG: chromosome segregation protein SMC, partial [Pseudomonadota bacterium]
QLAGWLAHTYAVDTLAEATALRSGLALDESIVTKQGEWIGSNWALIGQDQIKGQGLLQREALLDELAEKVQETALQLESLDQRSGEIQAKIKLVETDRDTHRIDFRFKSHRRTELHNQLGRLEARSAELLGQRDQLIMEKHGLSDQLSAAKSDVEQARKLMDDAKLMASQFEEQRSELSGERATLIEVLEAARKSEREARDQHQAKSLDAERLVTEKASLQESIARLQSQLSRQDERRQELQLLLSDEQDPSEKLRAQLQELLNQRLEVEKELSAARNALAEFENQMRSADQQRVGFDQKSQSVRDALEQAKLDKQAVLVLRNAIAEELNQTEAQMRAGLTEIAEDASLAEMESNLLTVQGKLDRIGAVNLVAIEEYDECTERKVYLDKQHADLTEAMATLEKAINKIDRETRTRFKDTFEKLNEGFKEFFPKLFGGGSAYLELTSQELLDTGVTVMARPPGKRNSTIHLLSGGEKALTAVSLLFAFFELNPAPFCVLDEVDAPLDDANVERYAGLLKQLSNQTQLLFITHNKITMEVADVLVGVTMAEAGVSRLVAVDVAEAAAMATQ